MAVQDPQAAHLPEGEGRQILQTACTTCHGLKEVTKFRVTTSVKSWQDIVRTMVAYGAEIDDEQTRILIDYLTKNFGPKPTEAPR